MCCGGAHPKVTLYGFFAGNVGGYMGLLLGASVVTVFEVIDLFVYNLIIKIKHKVARKKKTTPVETPNLNEGDCKETNGSIFTFKEKSEKKFWTNRTCHIVTF